MGNLYTYVLAIVSLFHFNDCFSLLCRKLMKSRFAISFGQHPFHVIWIKGNCENSTHNTNSRLVIATVGWLQGLLGLELENSAGDFMAFRLLFHIVFDRFVSQRGDKNKTFSRQPQPSSQPRAALATVKPFGILPIKMFLFTGIFHKNLLMKWFWFIFMIYASRVLSFGRKCSVIIELQMVPSK